MIIYFNNFSCNIVILLYDWLVSKIVKIKIKTVSVILQLDNLPVHGKQLVQSPTFHLF